MGRHGRGPDGGRVIRDGRGAHSTHLSHLPQLPHPSHPPPLRLCRLFCYQIVRRLNGST